MFRALLALTLLMLSACATRHHDVLVFGTDTSFGVNVGADPANAQVTNVSIGYKRREAVWMPLIINGTDSAIFCEQWSSDGKKCLSFRTDDAWNPKYRSEAQGISDTIGGTTKESDAYSVFASFGGEAGGGAGNAKVAVAQFFATGIAAQRLGSNPSAAQLVSTKAPDTDGEQAKGKVAAYESSTATLASANATQALATTNTNAIVDCLFNGNDDAAKRSAKLAAVRANVPRADPDADDIESAKTPGALREVLQRDSLVNSLGKIATACNAAG